MIGPTNYQYGGQPNTTGLIELARGWFNSAGELIVPKSGGAAISSPDQYQYITPSTPKAKSPTDFQFASASAAQATPTTTSVELDGGTRIFDDLKNAAKDTLLTGLDNYISGQRGGNTEPTPVSQPTGGGQIAGIPLGAVIAVAVVGAGIYYLSTRE